MAIVRFNKQDDNYPVFSRFLENFFNEDQDFFTPRYTRRVPAVNVSEDNDKFIIEVAAPGMKKDDFKINLDNNVITIEAQKEMKNEENDSNYTRREFCFDSFSRSFTLPESINSDKIDAKYNEGVLFVHLPKREEAKQKPARQIKIG